MKIALVLLATAACAEPAVEMKLVVPAPSSMPFDMSCVGAIDLLPIPENDVKSLDIGYREFNDMERVPCVDLDHAPTSFDDVEAMIRGRFTAPLPTEGLAAIELRGRAGTCNDVPAYHEAVFYGGALYKAGQETISIPVAHNISCDAAATYTIHPIDLIALVQTKQCAPVTNPGSQVFAGNIRPTMLDPLMPVLFEDGPSYNNLKTATATLDTYKSTWAGTCAAAGWEDSAGNVTATCINPGAPTACGAAGEVELPTMDFAYMVASVDKQLITQYRAPIIGAVWTTAGTAGPVAGATITLDAGSKAQVVYGDPGATAFTAAASATATTASGMFMIYANGITGITVGSPGKTSRHVWVGGDSGRGDAGVPGTSIVVLN